METPNLVTGDKVAQADMSLFASSIRSIAQAFLDLLLAQQNCVIPGGFALSAVTGTPIKIAVAAGVAFLNGYDIAVSAGDITLSPADGTYGRYDLLTVAYSQVAGIDSAGNPVLTDVGTLGAVTGTPAGSPVVPSCPVGSVWLGWVLVPAGATSATACTITTSPGPLVPKNLQDLTNHIAAVFNQSAYLHGFEVTLPGARGQNALLAGGSVNGGAGGLERYAPLYNGSGATAGNDGYMYATSNGPAATDGGFWEYHPPADGSNTAAKLSIAAGSGGVLSLLTFLTAVLHLNGVTTAGSATSGGASGLPGAPATYVEIMVNGVTYKVPAYNV